MNTKNGINRVLNILGQRGFDPTTIEAGNATLAIKKLLPNQDIRWPHAKILRELKRQRLVEVSSGASTVTFCLTPAGAYRLQNNRIREITIPKLPEWDGRWRLLSFDIPLSQSSQRLQFTMHLRRLNFFMLQRSLWLFPYPCLDQIQELAGHYNLWRYCVYMEIDQIDTASDNKLKRHFFS